MGFETRLTPQIMPLVKQELSLPEHLSLLSMFCVVRAVQSLVYMPWVVLCPFLPFVHCVVCPSSISFWLYL